MKFLGKKAIRRPQPALPRRTAATVWTADERRAPVLVQVAAKVKRSPLLFAAATTPVSRHAFATRRLPDAIAVQPKLFVGRSVRIAYVGSARKRVGVVRN